MSVLLNQIRDVMRVRRYSLQTEKTDIYWMRKYIFFHDVRHPKEMGADEVGAFLTHLAVTENVAATTQNQAMFPSDEAVFKILYLALKNISKKLDNANSRLEWSDESIRHHI
jgi:hypothetical protein